ncbi:MAG: hypothetical protein ACLFUX_09055, partial [Spirochaetaceae bacterium]
SPRRPLTPLTRSIQSGRFDFPLQFGHNIRVAKATEREIAVVAPVPSTVGPSDLTQLIERLEAEDRLRELPVTWGFASAGILDDSAVVAAVKKRARSHGDVVATAGYTGAPHPLLLRSELEAECDLGLTNESATGVRDLFPRAPKVLLTSVPDLHRRTARATYSRRFHAVFAGVSEAGGLHTTAAGPKMPALGPGRGRRGLRAARFLRRDAVYSLPVIRCCAHAGRGRGGSETREILRQRHRAVILLLLINEPGAIEAYNAAVAELSDASATARFVTLEADWIENHGNRNEATVLTRNAPCSIRGLYTSAAVAAARAGRDRPEDVLAALVSEHRLTAAFEQPCDGTPPTGRTIHASMMGTVGMRMGECEASFTRGRLSQLAGPVQGKHRRAITDPIYGHLRTREATTVLSPENAFSFADGGTGARGLMTVHSLGGKSPTSRSRLLIDYAAVGDLPWLVLDVCLEFPRLMEEDAVEELIPLSIPVRLPERRDQQVVRTRYPDDTEARIEIGEMNGTGCICGSVLFVGERLTVAFMENRPATTGVFRFHVGRSFSRSTLSLEPFGRYGPAEAAERAGSSARVRLALGPGVRGWGELDDLSRSFSARTSAGSPSRRR